MRKLIIILAVLLAATAAVQAKPSMTIRNLKMLIVIYRGAPDDANRLSDHQVKCMKNGIEVARLFYFRNSNCMLHLDYTYMVLDRRAPDHAGPTYEHIVTDLRSRGIKDNQYDGIFCTGLGFTANYGGFRVFDKTGAAFGMGYDETPDYEWWPDTAPDTYYSSTWMISHEFQHALDLVICNMAGHPEMLHDHPYADYDEDYFWWGHRAGQHFDWVAHTLSTFKDYLDVPGATDSTIVTMDADEDGLPDDDPRLPMDEKRFGSDPKKKDTDGDGLTDFEEFTADMFRGSDPKNKDTDGDGVIDGKDLNPTVAITDTMTYAAADPKIDGKLDASYKPFVTGMYTYNSPTLADGRLSACWNEDALFLFVKSKTKCSLEVWVDSSYENGYWEGGDTYVIRADPDGKVAIIWPNTRPIAEGKAVWGEDGLEVKIPALLGQGVSLEINFGGKRRPEDVSDGLRLLNDRMIGFNMKLINGNDKALITPNHAMFGTKLVKSPTDPPRPSLRFTKSLITDPKATVVVCGTGPNDKVTIVDASGNVLGERTGDGEVVLKKQLKAGHDAATGMNVLKARASGKESAPFTVVVDNKALPPVVSPTSDGSVFEIRGEPGARVDILVGQSEKSSQTPIISVFLNDEGIGSFHLDKITEGFVGAYGLEQNFDQPVLWRIDPEIKFSYEWGGPDPRVTNDGFFTRWTGYLSVPKSGEYTFYLGTDDGSRLYIDGKLIIDNWGTHGLEEGLVTMKTYLEEGEHAIRIDYYEGGGWAAAHLEWSGPGIQRTYDLPVSPIPISNKDYFFFARQVDIAGNTSESAKIGN
ncbi:MAG TPA: PA14 domain-containing protein [Armatimonadota bacterium]|nr:PA14 domain-containing protein [Armatimonadota bacterium]